MTDNKEKTPQEVLEMRLRLAELKRQTEREARRAKEAEDKLKSDTTAPARPGSRAQQPLTTGFDRKQLLKWTFFWGAVGAAGYTASTLRLAGLKQAFMSASSFIGRHTPVLNKTRPWSSGALPGILLGAAVAGGGGLAFDAARDLTSSDSNNAQRTMRYGMWGFLINLAIETSKDSQDPTDRQTYYETLKNNTVGHGVELGKRVTEKAASLDSAPRDPLHKLIVQTCTVQLEPGQEQRIYDGTIDRFYAQANEMANEEKNNPNGTVNTALNDRLNVQLVVSSPVSTEPSITVNGFKLKEDMRCPPKHRSVVYDAREWVDSRHGLDARAPLTLNP